MGFLLRLWVNALFKGNPFVVGVTVLGGLALSAGAFYEGVTSRDPVALGLIGLLLGGMLVILTVAIVDRRMNPPRGKGRGASGAGRR